MITKKAQLWKQTRITKKEQTNHKKTHPNAWQVQSSQHNVLEPEFRLSKDPRGASSGQKNGLDQLDELSTGLLVMLLYILYRAKLQDQLKTHGAHILFEPELIRWIMLITATAVICTSAGWGCFGPFGHCWWEREQQSLERHTAKLHHKIHTQNIHCFLPTPRHCYSWIHFLRVELGYHWRKHRKDYYMIWPDLLHPSESTFW